MGGYWPLHLFFNLLETWSLMWRRVELTNFRCNVSRSNQDPKSRNIWLHYEMLTFRLRQGNSLSFYFLESRFATISQKLHGLNWLVQMFFIRHQIMFIHGLKNILNIITRHCFMMTYIFFIKLLFNGLSSCHLGNEVFHQLDTLVLLVLFWNIQLTLFFLFYLRHFFN